MGVWIDPDTYEIDASARGIDLQTDAAIFWLGVFEKLLTEQSPYERVMIETSGTAAVHRVRSGEESRPGR